VSQQVTNIKSQQNRQTIRQHFRKQRNLLNGAQQKLAAQACLQKCLASVNLARLKTVACYLTNDAELDPSAIIQYCWQQKIQVLLPVLDSSQAGHLIFVDYQSNSPMQTNIYGIAEPIATISNTVAIQDIDLIFTPLVAFDHKGNRLGMGGGYYDRSLAPIKEKKLSTQIIGLAHDCQQAEQLPTDGWDIPLHGIVTATKYFHIDRSV
jgi:5-formyltetrahydrofolate cyclo-ligase